MQEYPLIKRVAPDEEVTERVQQNTGGAYAHHGQRMMHRVEMVDVYQSLQRLDDEGEAEGGEEHAAAEHRHDVDARPPERVLHSLLRPRLLRRKRGELDNRDAWDKVFWGCTV